ncbi:hypothetical protein EI555_005718 [Monodon monoceros]|uniref:Uncharacterized protein n=1 Tax=Monodon monoceros TaxID=40151 RepID=A0A4U1FPJ5_MONMO|nr:hypothetical protein EI555_005718 [Monodon monoceros]
MGETGPRVLVGLVVPKNLSPFGRRSRVETGDAAASKPGVWARCFGTTLNPAGTWRWRRRDPCRRPCTGGCWAARWPLRRRCSTQQGPSCCWRPATRNRDSEAFVQLLLWLRGRGCLHHVSPGPFDAQASLCQARCRYLQPGWVDFLGRILDVGFVGRWWVLGARMRDCDINDDEFLHLPAHLRAVGPHQLHSEANERLFDEKYKPVVLTDDQSSKDTPACLQDLRQLPTLKRYFGLWECKILKNVLTAVVGINSEHFDTRTGQRVCGDEWVIANLADDQEPERGSCEDLHVLKAGYIRTGFLNHCKPVMNQRLQNAMSNKSLRKNCFK